MPKQHGYWDLKGKFVSASSRAEATAAWRAERGYDPVGVFDMGDVVVDTRGTSYDKSKAAAEPAAEPAATPAEEDLRELYQTEGSLARYLAGEVAAPPREQVYPAPITDREVTPDLTPADLERGVRAPAPRDLTTRSLAGPPEQVPTTVIKPTSVQDALTQVLSFRFDPTPAITTLPGQLREGEVAPTAGPTFYTGDQALDIRIEGALEHHKKIGSTLSEEEIIHRVSLTAEGFHPDLKDEKGNPVPIVDAVFDPHSEIYNDNEAEDWLRRVAYKQVHRKDMMDVRQEDAEVTGRNITRVMEKARMEVDDPDHIRDAMPDIMSIEGAMIAAAQQGISVEEFLALWQFENLDPAGRIWQKKEPGGGGVGYSYEVDDPDPRRTFRGTSPSRGYDSSSKLAFDWRVRIT